MFRGWAEGRMYRRSMQIAVAELRRAARSANALEKLQCLEVAEQKLKDAVWLRPDAGGERFDAGLAEIQRSREKTLHEQGLPAAEHLLEAAGKFPAEKGELLREAGELLSLLDHYLPEEDRVEELSARFRQLGGEPTPYQAVQPLSKLYHRPSGGVGCGALVGGLLVASVLTWVIVR